MVNRSLVKVTRVIDGDSLMIQGSEGGPELEIRLHGIDAPEHRQRHGRRATTYLTELTEGKTFFLEVTTSADAYGRVVGVLYERVRWDSLNRKMVDAGLAFNYSRYGALEGIYQTERNAQRRRLGVWRMAKGDVRPWVYRRMSREQQRQVELTGHRRRSHQQRVRYASPPPKRKSFIDSHPGLVGVMLLLAFELILSACEELKRRL